MNSGILIVVLSSLILLLFSIFFIGFAIFHNRKMIANHKKVQQLEKEKSRKELVDAIQIQEKERQRIGADIHDDLGPTMIAIKLKLNRLSGKEAPKEKDLNQLTEMMEETILNVRGLSQSMYPSTLEKYGLVNALKEMGSRIQSATDIKVEIEIEEGAEELGDDEKLNIYRIIQEFCNNSVKHSACKLLKINILEEKGLLKIEVSDDGNGFDLSADNGSGLGLRNMEMRARAINFSFDMSSNSDGSHIFLSSKIASDF